MLEMELKFRIDGFGPIEELLKKMGVDPCEPVTEKNYILDMQGGPLRKTDTLLRLRTSGDDLVLTVKKPLPSTCLKVRFEREIVLDCDLDQARELFGLLGYGTVYTYEKKRREVSLGEARVCLDELWFGRYVEIEASSEEAVMSAVDRLNLDPEEGIRFSYAALEQDARDRGESESGS